MLDFLSLISESLKQEAVRDIHFFILGCLNFEEGGVMDKGHVDCGVIESM